MLALWLIGVVIGCRDPAEPERAVPLTGSPEQWVRVLDPARASPGFTLTLFQHRIPTLLDLNGRVVHSWPRARVKSRVRLLDDCNLLGIALGRGVVEYDWNGEEVWSHEFPGEVPHHDVIRLANGNTLVVTLPDGDPMDVIREIDHQGQETWHWRAGEHLEEFVASAFSITKGDVTHINSLQELPPNPHFDRGDDRFRPGNLMVSARNLDLIFVIDRQSSEVVWSYRRDLDLQHEAVMKPSGFPGAGNVLVFDNGKRSRREWRRSRVLEIDPLSGETEWTYSADDFFSQTGGLAQPLPNGNVLISSSVGGRVFEVDRRGETVWLWTPPFEPTRPLRVAADHCPQLTGLSSPPPVAVELAVGERYVDRDLYRFVNRGAVRRRQLEGQERRLLRRNDLCVEVMLPTGARAQLGFGVDSESARRSSAPLEATFALKIAEEVGSRTLFARTLKTDQSSWESAEVDLGDEAGRRLNLCVEVRDGDERLGSTEAWALWASPFFESGSAVVFEDSADGAADESQDGDLDPDELEVRRRLLETHGYVN